jgi:hypothetical protein
MELVITNREIVEQGMLTAAQKLLENKLPIQTRLPLSDFAEYAAKKARKFWENVKIIADKYQIPDNTKFDNLTGPAKEEMDFLRNYSGKIQMDPIPRPAESVEGTYELILNKLFIKKESFIKEIEEK